MCAQLRCDPDTRCSLEQEVIHGLLEDEQIGPGSRFVGERPAGIAPDQLARAWARTAGPLDEFSVRN